MSGQLTGSMGRVMDGLVASARAGRDTAVNTLDAVDRQTKAASEQLARTVVTVAPPSAADLERWGLARRDDRFDPEDWANAEQSAAPTGTGPAANASAVTGDEDEDYPETWLR